MSDSVVVIPCATDQWSESIEEDEYISLSCQLYTAAEQAYESGLWVTEDDIVIVASRDSECEHDGSSEFFDDDSDADCCSRSDGGSSVYDNSVLDGSVREADSVSLHDGSTVIESPRLQSKHPTFTLPAVSRRGGGKQTDRHRGGRGHKHRPGEFCDDCPEIVRMRRHDAVTERMSRSSASGRSGGSDSSRTYRDQFANDASLTANDKKWLSAWGGGGGIERRVEYERSVSANA